VPLHHDSTHFDANDDGGCISVKRSTRTAEHRLHQETMSKDLDKAFEFIEEGNELEKSGDHWQAADRFGQAMKLLEKLADYSPSDTQEQEKIAQLYQGKSREYRQTAREAFIQALTHEKERDSQSDDGATIVSTVSMQEAEDRIKTFSLLFSKTVEDIGEKTSLLEERLMELNASLPSGFKTSKERMADINRGLGRLGLSLYSSSDHGSSTDIQPPQSEEDQVAQIIAQAKDEVRYEAKPSTTGDAGKHDAEASAGDTSSVNDSTSDSDDSDDSVSLDDLVDEPVFKNRKVIRHKVVKAQVKLAELIALLNTEPEINLSDDIEEKGEENGNDEEGKPAGFDVAYGKATLTAARNYLDKALKDWPDDSS